MHTMVPGPDGDFGFGGKCFPKDINAMIKFIESNNVEPVMLKAAWNKNAEIRKNLNWLLIDGAVSKKEK
jgi:UDPglucose 6-dehydrogenase